MVKKVYWAFRDVTAETVRADQIPVRADDAPTTAAARSAPPVRSNVPHRSPTLTDEEIVSRFVIIQILIFGDMPNSCTLPNFWIMQRLTLWLTR